MKCIGKDSFMITAKNYPLGNIVVENHRLGNFLRNELMNIALADFATFFKYFQLSAVF